MVAFAPPETFKHRADFQRLAARGRKLVRPGFVMQALRGDEAEPARVGFTATRKLGNAVARNRARRRLREAARLAFAETRPDGLQMVLICRRETAALPFAALCADLRSAVAEALR